MSLKFPNYVNTPPGGWRYTVPETGKTIGPFSNWEQLESNVLKHYAASGYEAPRTTLLDLVEAQICSAEPDYCGKPGIIGRFASYMVASAHTFHTAFECLSTLIKNRTSGTEKPSQELADRRAATCSECPQNKEVTGCSTCSSKKLGSLIEKIVGASRTKYDGQLRYCAVCHCNLRAKVWTKHDAIWDSMGDGMKAALPETCWVKQENSSQNIPNP